MIFIFLHHLAVPFCLVSLQLLCSLLKVQPIQLHKQQYFLLNLFCHSFILYNIVYLRYTIGLVVLLDLVDVLLQLVVEEHQLLNQFFGDLDDNSAEGTLSCGSVEPLLTLNDVV